MSRLLRWFVLVTLGLLLSLSWHRLPRAGASLPLMQTPPAPVQTVQADPHALIQAAKDLYDAQRYAEANQQLQQAVQTYAASGNVLQQAQALGLQSLVLQKLGEWDEAQTVIDQSLSLLADSPSAPRIQAQVLNAQGHLYLGIGQPDLALESWKAAEDQYAAAEDEAGQVGSRINQLQAMQSLGLYRQASRMLTDLEAQIEAMPDSQIKVKGLLNFGNLLRLRGELERSQSALSTGLKLAQDLELSEDVSQLYLSLGNTKRVLAARAVSQNVSDVADTYYQSALEAYESAIAMTTSPLSQLQAQLNQLSLLVQTSQFQAAQALIPTIQQQLAPLLPSRAGVYAQVNFAHSLMELDGKLTALQRSPSTAFTPVDLPKLLTVAIEQAQSIQDERAAAYATGTLGNWYELQQDWTTAKKLTADALQKAQSLRAAEIAYQWQWQMGRLIQAETEASYTNQAPESKALIPANSEAIRYYSATVETLDDLRSDLVALNPDVQFSFRESVEPVYRELVDLLLRDEHPAPEKLLQAQKVIESLQLAELDNFFRDACAKPEAVNVGNVDPTAAVMYPIMLPDRLEIILQLPEASRSTATQAKSNPESSPEFNTESNTAATPELVHIRQPNLEERELYQVAESLRRDLKLVSTPTGRIKEQAQQIYDWLIQPLADPLEKTSSRDQSAVKTLVFVLDGPLRNLPMALLYDGEHYLVERYAIAVTPGLQLLDPKPLERRELNVLLGGAVDAPSFQTFALAPLENVPQELSSIETTIPNSQVLEDQAFLEKNIQTFINEKPFNVIHLATHGQFSSNPEQTFILDAEQPISAQEIDDLLAVDDPQRAVENPIELLILSACETAAGDSRAALGLAGIAIRAGARSTVATLWQVNDQSTSQFMVQFYQELANTQVTKAEALRNVQLSFLAADPTTRYNRPNRWAPFILVGNWL